MKGFRVYDTTEKRYVTNELNWVVTPDGNLCELDNGDLIGHPHCIKEDYTGLTDNNGKKIFEGDIMNWVDMLDKGRQVRGTVVMFSFRWCVKNIFNGDYENWNWSNNTHKAIGNIHDNEELLE